MILVGLRRVPSSNCLGQAPEEHFDVNAMGQHLENIALQNYRFVESRGVPVSQNVMSEP